MRLNKYYIYTTALFLIKPSSCHRDLWAEAGGHGKSDLIENFESIFGDESNFEHGFGKHGGDKDSKLVRVFYFSCEQGARSDINDESWMTIIDDHGLKKSKITE